MKKIVALVLSLALALSLCTVAFAVSNGDVFYDGQNYGATEYKYVAAGDNNIAYLTDGTNNYAIGGAADKALWVNGTTKADITLGAKLDVVAYNYTGKAVEAQKWSCTTDQHAKGFLANDQYWVADKAGETFLLVDGKIVAVKADDTYLKGQHVICVPVAGAKEVGVGVYEGYCAACKQTLQFTYTNINGAGYLFSNVNAEWFELAQNWITVSIPVGYAPLFVPCYVVAEQKDATTTAAADKGTSSPKTFDAGIAMYVGMSLMSVAGSAVVIGKKKEF